MMRQARPPQSAKPEFSCVDKPSRVVKTTSPVHLRSGETAPTPPHRSAQPRGSASGLRPAPCTDRWPQPQPRPASRLTGPGVRAFRGFYDCGVPEIAVSWTRISKRSRLF
nr:electron transfer flavoprotein regulatory factor 1 isoform X1 [Microcebus murinus]